MFTIALYSSDSRFFSGFGHRLAAELQARVPSFGRFRSFPLEQTRLSADEEAPPELCIVDLRDDPERSLRFAADLRQNTPAEVMVVAPSQKLAMAAYNADILSYLPNPPDPGRAAELILRRFFQNLPGRETRFSFRTAAGTEVLTAQRIVYIEYSDHRMIVHLDTRKQVVTNTLRLSFAEAAAQLLADGTFVRTHASFIVNARHISKFEPYSLLMDTGVSVPVSHAKHKEVKKRLEALLNLHP